MKKSKEWVLWRAMVCACLCLFYTGLSAQDSTKVVTPTFEQTVEYIVANTKGRVMYPGALDAYARVKGYNLEDITIEKNGRITFVTEQKNDYNDFSISFNVFDLESSTEYPEGVLAKDYLVHFHGLNVSSGYGIVYATQNDALKVARAFRHLRLVCQRPENDLFSQPVIEEKKVLGINETVNYINNTILPGGQFALSCSYCRNYDGKYSSDFFVDYYVQAAKFLSSTQLVISAEGGECVEYLGNMSHRISGGCDRTLDVTLNINFLTFVNYETRMFNGDPRFVVMTLNFENGSIIPSKLLPDIRYNYEYGFWWTTSYVQFFVKADSVEKTKKAFDHLISLVQEKKQKAEEADPFGN